MCGIVLYLRDLFRPSNRKQTVSKSTVLVKAKMETLFTY